MKKLILLFLSTVVCGLWTINCYATIAVIGSATNAGTTGSTLTITKPTGVQVGDVMIANISNYGSTSAGAPSLTGWTTITGTYADPGVNLRYAILLYRVVDGTEGASFAFTVPGSVTRFFAGTIVAFSGVDVSGANPFDAAIGAFSTSTGYSVSANSITTNTANSGIVFFGIVNNTQTNTRRFNSDWTTASQGALTEIYDNFISGRYIVTGAAWKIQATPGATGAASVSLNNPSDPDASYNGGILIALKEKVPRISGFSPTSACQGATGIVITGTNLAGASNVSFNGVSASYTVNSSTQITATVPLTATTGLISVTTAEGTATSASGFTVNPLPTAPSSSGTAVCSGNTATLSASGAVSGDRYKWYDAASGGNLLKTSTNNTDNTFITPSLTSTTSYWVSVLSSANCEGARTQVTVTVSNPSTSVTGQTNPGCYAASNGSITIQASGGIAPYQFSVNNGLNYVAGSNPFAYTGLSANVEYKIRVKDSIGCESQAIP